jgi:4-diphosphocytidyl-2-C-methyl-D-erythritol kinase
MPVRAALAKLNLSLKVLYRRPDGFHEIATVFQTISLADSLTVTARSASETRVNCRCDVPVEGENLAARAARLWLEQAGRMAEVNIEITKRIPMGGGLGGGSADAVAVLRCLEEQLGPGPALAPLAATLGSDLPFFLVAGCAVAGGRGETLEPLPDFEPVHGVLVAPGIGVSTPAAYAALKRPGRSGLTAAAEDEILVRFREFVALLREHAEPFAWCQLCENDFEAAVFEQYPILAQWLEKIEKTDPLVARMSGSGSTLFGLYRTQEQAALAAESLRVESTGHATEFRVETFHTVNRRQYERAWQNTNPSL